MDWVIVAAIVVGSLIGLVVILALLIYSVGARQPIEYTVVRQLQLEQPPVAVWSVVADHGREAEWNSRLRRVERLADHQGHDVWRLFFKGGGSPPCLLETIEANKPSSLVRTIVDDKKVFFGRWDFNIAPANGGSMVKLTEHGKIPSKFFRGMFKLFSKPAAQIEVYLRDLARKFGEPAEIAAGV